MAEYLALYSVHPEAWAGESYEPTVSSKREEIYISAKDDTSALEIALKHREGFIHGNSKCSLDSLLEIRPVRLNTKQRAYKKA